MYYCQKCHYLNEKDCCDNCGHQHLREPHHDDYCFLVEKEMIWAESLKEILDHHGIPYLCESSMGVGLALRVGPMLEQFQFYVPYSHYSQAFEIIEKMFK